MALQIISVSLILFTTLQVCTAVKMKLTNVHCESLDESLIKFRICRLKVIRRGVIALTIHAQLLQVVTDAVVRRQIIFKASQTKLIGLSYISGQWCILQKSQWL